MIKLKHLLKEELITEGTRWNVGLEATNGKVVAVYGHYDGYPQGVGKYLKKYYQTKNFGIRYLKKQEILSLQRLMLNESV